MEAYKTKHKIMVTVVMQPIFWALSDKLHNLNKYWSFYTCDLSNQRRDGEDWCVQKKQATDTKKSLKKSMDYYWNK